MVDVVMLCSCSVLYVCTYVCAYVREPQTQSVSAMEVYAALCSEEVHDGKYRLCTLAKKMKRLMYSWVCCCADLKQHSCCADFENNTHNRRHRVCIGYGNKGRN